MKFSRVLTLRPSRLLEVDPAFKISAFIARGGQSNLKLLIEALRKAGLPE
jgi:adenylate cyclase